jgi:hypothetical protein
VKGTGSLRAYCCARCRKRVLICSTCDRGNIFCSASCAALKRLESSRSAQMRYQFTFRGRIKHRARQRKYRAKQKSVTHQGSKREATSAVSLQQPEAPEIVAIAEANCTASVERPHRQKRCSHSHCCHFCGQSWSNYLRSDFLKTKKDPLGVLRL